MARPETPSTSLTTLPSLILAPSEQLVDAIRRLDPIANETLAVSRQIAQLANRAPAE